MANLSVNKKVVVPAQDEIVEKEIVLILTEKEAKILRDILGGSSAPNLHNIMKSGNYVSKANISDVYEFFNSVFRLLSVQFPPDPDWR